MLNDNDKKWIRAKTRIMVDGQEIQVPESVWEYFFTWCERTTLNPLVGEIYLTYSKKTGWQFLVGIEGLRRLAHDTGQVDYVQREPVYDDRGNLIAAIARLWKKGSSGPYVTRVLLREYSTGKGNWQQRPEAMLLKAAEAAVYRMAFPSLAGMYIREEMGDDFAIATATPATPSPDDSCAPPEHLGATASGSNSISDTEPKVEQQPSSKVSTIVGGVVTALNPTELAGKPAIEIVLDSGESVLAPDGLKVFDRLQIGCEVQVAPRSWHESLVISDDRQIRIVTAS